MQQATSYWETYTIPPPSHTPADSLAASFSTGHRDEGSDIQYAIDVGGASIYHCANHRFTIAVRPSSPSREISQKKKKRCSRFLDAGPDNARPQRKLHRRHRVRKRRAGTKRRRSNAHNVPYTRAYKQALENGAKTGMNARTAQHRDCVYNTSNKDSIVSKER